MRFRRRERDVLPVLTVSFESASSVRAEDIGALRSAKMGVHQLFEVVDGRKAAGTE